mmetsp:Transcript_23274/g.45197  ORF Transcript_23274/g.45197 Transcript_23274/m.45197 type:complete len:104 (-) Transcript_23274:200-511(-)
MQEGAAMGGTTGSAANKKAQARAPRHPRNPTHPESAMCSRAMGSQQYLMVRREAAYNRLIAVRAVAMETLWWVVWSQSTGPVALVITTEVRPADLWHHQGQRT